MQTSDSLHPTFKLDLGGAGRPNRGSEQSNRTSVLSDGFMSNSGPSKDDDESLMKKVHYESPLHVTYSFDVVKHKSSPSSNSNSTLVGDHQRKPSLIRRFLDTIKMAWNRVWKRRVIKRASIDLTEA